MRLWQTTSLAALGGLALGTLVGWPARQTPTTPPPLGEQWPGVEPLAMPEDLPLTLTAAAGAITREAVTLPAAASPSAAPASRGP